MGDTDKDNETAGLHQELADLEAAIVRQDSPLGTYTRATALAKIAKLRQRIKELEN